MIVLEFIVNEILSKPALLIGLMALIGLVAMLRAPSEILSGTLKTILGFIILIGGAGIVVGALTPLGTMVQVGFHLHGVVPTNEAIVALAQKAFGAQTAIIMALGFVANLALARFTPAKYVFLAGPKSVEAAAGGGNYVMYAFTEGLTFGAGVAVILLGVRMIIAEIVPAFAGIAERIVPKAMPALDCPTTFPYAPNAVVIGFI